MSPQRFIVQQTLEPDAASLAEAKQSLECKSSVKIVEESASAFLVELTQESAEGVAPRGWEIHPLKSTPAPNVRPAIRKPLNGSPGTKRQK